MMKGQHMRIKEVIVSTLSLVLVAFAAGAQTSTTGSIEGVVTDPNGAAVKGANVTVTSPNLMAARTAPTNDEGRYQILALPPGTYKVVVDASGFGKYEQEGVAVNLGRTSSID